MQSNSIETIGIYKKIYLKIILLQLLVLLTAAFGIDESFKVGHWIG